jgi:pimeloyl-ACP methyl ester carboxylesterase
MNRRWIGAHLAAGFDVALCDPRGTAESSGEASEEGYNLDAELFLSWIQERSYADRQIYVSGYCEGASVAMQLRETHPDVHLIAENYYDSLERMVLKYNCLGRLIGKVALTAIRSRHPDTISMAHQFNATGDYFNNVEKCRRFAPGGKVILMPTRRDRSVPKTSTENIRNALRVDYTVLERTDGGHHMQPPSEYAPPDYWHAYVEACET